jgi:hypothetical protein
MPSGTYDVVVSTPMGKVDGKAVLNVEGTTLSGTLSLLGQDNAFTNGVIDADGNIKVEGDLATPAGKFTYTISGTFINGQIDAIAKTNMGNLEIKSK